MKKMLILLLVAALLTACTAPAAPTDPTQTEPVASSGQAAQPLQTDALFSNRDLDGTYDAGWAITFSGTSIQAEGATVEGSTVTLSEEGTYVLSGALTDGMVIVDAPKNAKLQLVLAGVQLHSETAAPIYIRQADKVFITLAGANSLSNGGTFTAIDENNIDGVIFSREDLTLNGTGSLEIASPAGHGIVSKDSLKITGGSYVLTTASHGIAGKDDVCITSADCTITSGKDAIHAENSEDTSLGFVYIQSGSFRLDAQGDGISAAAQLQIDDGQFDVTTGGGSENAQKKTSENWGGFGGGHGGMGGRPGGMGDFDGGFGGMETTDTAEDSTSIKALKAGTQLTINGGSFTIDSADDAVHSNGDIYLKGGSLTIASGDDGFHADETLTVAAGTVTITESYEGLEGLHIWMSGGAVTLTASDDGLNAAGGTDQSGFGGFRGGDMFGGPGGKGGMGGPGGGGNGSIVISGGTLRITASGDGIDANGTLQISGGHTTVCGPTRGDTATLDYDTSAEITGGTFLGTGASGMAQTFSGSEQGVLAVQVGNGAAGTQITVADSTGKILLSHTPALDFAVVILSSPELAKGETYTLTVGASSKDITAN